MKKLLILASLLALLGSSASAAKVPKMFTTMDANKDGQVDVKEWLEASAAAAKKSGKPFDKEKALKRMIRKDHNGDKAISVEEFVAARKSMNASQKKAKKAKKD